MFLMTELMRANQIYIGFAREMFIFKFLLVEKGSQ